MHAQEVSIPKFVLCLHCFGTLALFWYIDGCIEANSADEGMLIGMGCGLERYLPRMGIQVERPRLA